MNYNRARSIINHVLVEGGYIEKCTHPINKHCANLNTGGGSRFCKVTQQKSCLGCRFATIGGPAERIVVAETIERQNQLVKEKDAEIERKKGVIKILEDDIDYMRHEQRTSLYLAKRDKRRRRARA